MTVLKLGEQIAFLRKQKGLTQEDLAQALGVSNQAVSKWESEQCCPDISLLPELSAFFGVTIDRLMGCQPPENIETLYTDIYLDIKALFTETPEQDCFHRAFRLAVLLHEAVCSKGYKAYIPWDTEKNHGLKSGSLDWDFSACTEPEGATVLAESGVFLSDSAEYKSPTAAQLRALCQTLENLADRNVLKVLFGLYDLTRNASDRFVPLSAIASQARLSPEETQAVLDRFPVEIQTEEGQELYRLSGCFLHIPPLLLMLRLF